jgi:hypothetical protein
MGWLKGGALARILNPFATEIALPNPGDPSHPWRGRWLILDAAGVLFRASRYGAKDVVRHGISEQAKAYIRRTLEQMRSEGARVFLALDGGAFPAKARVRAERRNGRQASR